jgi:hypothetical protein
VLRDRIQCRAHKTTIAALVLGMLVGSVKSSSDSVNTRFTQGAQKSSCSTGLSQGWEPWQAVSANFQGFLDGIWQSAEPKWMPTSSIQHHFAKKIALRYP